MVKCFVFSHLGPRLFMLTVIFLWVSPVNVGRSGSWSVNNTVTCETTECGDGCLDSRIKKIIISRNWWILVNSHLITSLYKLSVTRNTFYSYITQLRVKSELLLSSTWQQLIIYTYKNCLMIWNSFTIKHWPRYMAAIYTHTLLYCNLLLFWYWFK